LTNIFTQQYAADNNVSFAIMACRYACYSDLDCNYWQYFEEDGCWTNVPSQNSIVPSPLTETDVSRVLTGRTILDGEFISHWARPPQCPVIAVTNAAGTDGSEPCGAGITFIVDGADCTMDCATGYTPSTTTATCANRVVAPVTCNPDACNVPSSGPGGIDEPCGTGVTSIDDGNNCTVTCASGFRAHPAEATCAHGTLASIECRVISPCTVVAVTNAAGTGGSEPCGTGVDSILNGDECTMRCATGFHPSAASATCTSGTLDPVTCEANLPCSVGTVTNAKGTGGNEPCGTGITSIDDGHDCTLDCASEYRAVSAAATCTNGVLASRECRVIAPCAVVAVTNAAGTDGVSPCGTGITSILNGEQCTAHCATGFHPVAATTLCTSGTLQPITCAADPPAPPATGPPYLLIGLALLTLLIALLVTIVMCSGQKPKSAKTRAVKPIKKKEPPAPPPAPTQSRPVAVMMPTYVQAPQFVQAQAMAQAVQVSPTVSLQR